LLEKGPVAIVFHRGHWCPYCRINTRALAEVQEQIVGEGGQLAAITPERQWFAAELKRGSDAKFPVLTDMDNGYALSLNLAIWVGRMEEILAAADCICPVPGQRSLAASPFPLPLWWTTTDASRPALSIRTIAPDGSWGNHWRHSNSQLEPRIVIAAVLQTREADPDSTPMDP
jgi:hypothetical protein